MSTQALFRQFDDETYHIKNGGRHDQLILSQQVISQWRSLVAFRKAMNLLHWAMCTVSYRCTAKAIKTASIVGTFFINVVFSVALAAAGAIRSDWLPGGGF